jgi:protein-L-isoaspartate(D-aspartate) O-methyltransferase
MTLKVHTRKTITFMILIALSFFFFSCSSKPKSYAEKRMLMTENLIKKRGIENPRILKAFQTVPREEFVLPKYKEKAHEDIEVPIAFGETLNRPYEDAVMLASMEIEPHHKVLEIGTGTGYHTALLSQLADKVYTIEIEPEYAKKAKSNFEKLGYKNIFPKTGDGFAGWPEFAPFHRIVMMCSPSEIPIPLKNQLAENGLMILPLGGSERFQELFLYTKKNGELIKVRSIAPTTFSPMKGQILEMEDQNP